MIPLQRAAADDVTFGTAGTAAHVNGRSGNRRVAHTVFRWNSAAPGGYLVRKRSTHARKTDHSYLE